jgi:hypothetical protein
MRKGLLALPTIIVAGLLPLAVSAADVCTRISGKGLFDGVCDVCFNEGRCQIADFFIVGNSVIKLILGISGAVMLLMVIYGGFIWLASGGNSGMVDKGKKVLIGAVVGLIIVFGAYTSMQFLVAALVCNNGNSCPVVNEIFARPFQAVKPPGPAKPVPAPTAPTDGSTPASDNPTGGTPAATGGTCDCKANLTGDKISDEVCKNVKGFSCNFYPSSSLCSCSGNLNVGENDCNLEGFKSTTKSGSIPGIDVNGGCSWTATP